VEQEADNMESGAIPLIRTKLYRPQVTSDLVERPRLTEMLYAGLNRRLTLVSAPAGYGKTTVVSAWSETCGCPTVWLSLDEYDNDLALFLTYFTAAIQTIYPDACQNIRALLQTAELPSVRLLAANLINELESIQERFIVVLDDYHVIREPSIHDFLDELLRHPPRSLHLTITTRIDPSLDLINLRARGQLREIRVYDLRFTASETAALFEHLYDDTAPATVVERLSAQTEGWITGLRLAALAVRDPSELERHPSGFPGERYATDYLVSEALGRQSPAVQDWLLKTSILDRFCAPLCDEICAHEDGEQAAAHLNGQTFIARLRQTHLFVQPLDERRRWYRYHHLFQQILQQKLASRLDDDQIATLHRRASAWHAQQGNVDEAIHHAMIAGDMEAAVGLVACYRHDYMNREAWHILNRWLRRFPPALVEKNYELLLTRSWLNYYWHYDLAAWERNLDRIEALMAANPPAPDVRAQVECEVAAMRSGLLFWQSRGGETAELAERALQTAPARQECVRSTALMHWGGGLQVIGDGDRAETALTAALHDGTYRQPSSTTRILATLCFVEWLQGNLTGVVDAGLRLQQIGEEQNMPASISYARYFLGIAYYERNDLAAAEVQLRPLIENVHHYPMQNVAQSVFPLAMAYCARGEIDRARKTVKTLADLAFERDNRQFLQMVEAFTAELNLISGRVAEANQWGRKQEMTSFLSMHRFYLPELTLAKTLLAQNSASAREQAATLLADMFEHATTIHNVRVQMEVLALQALLEHARGNETAALEKLGRAVHLAEPGGWLRLFVDLGTEMATLLKRLYRQDGANAFVERIFAAFPAAAQSRQTKSDQSALIEPLTERELDVLALLAQGLSNRQIAEQLVITPGTVSQHTHNIYGKLLVGTRQQAVIKATHLGILPNA